jgi:hypothetical protein
LLWDSIKQYLRLGCTYTQIFEARKGNLKKIIVLIALACLVGSAAYAQIPVNMNKGDLAASVGFNFGWDYGVGAGIEYMFARVDIADAVPITFGLAAKGGAGFMYGTNFILVGLATAHFGLGFIPELPTWIRKFDFYYGLGLGTGLGAEFGIGLGNGGGVSYFIKPDLAIYSSVIYARYFDNTGKGSGFGSLGLIFKL